MISPLFSALTLGICVAAAAASTTPIPYPTVPQLKYLEGGIMALIHFNMGTFFGNGDPSCNANNWPGSQGSSNPNSFAPTNLNTSQWMTYIKAVGATSSVITAKHGCGFYIWESQVQLPNGTVYPYQVNSTTYGNVLQQYVDSSIEAGLGYGFYYSLTNNFYLNAGAGKVGAWELIEGMVNVTQEQYESISAAALTELWTNFGQLSEIWLDGGYITNMQGNLSQLLATNQPNTVVFNGQGVSNNPIRWCGTESGVISGDDWGTTCSFQGQGCSPNSTGAAWSPPAVDFTLQEGDVWFYTPGLALHPLQDLVDVYHNSIMNGGRLELDFAIDTTGNVHPTHAAAYTQFGEWIASCYGQSVAEIVPPAGSKLINLNLPGNGTIIDRVVLEEDLLYSQLVYGWSVDVQAVNGTWYNFGSGLSIGSKRIAIGVPVEATTVTVTIVDSLDVTHLKRVSAYSPDGCATE